MLLFQLLEGVRRMQLMQDMPIDIDELAAIGALRDHMRVPDFLEQRFRHRLFAPPHDGRGKLSVSPLANCSFWMWPEVRLSGVWKWMWMVESIGVKMPRCRVE